MNKLELICDNCKKDITVTEYDIRTEVIKDDLGNKVLSYRYFACKSCGKQHIIEVEDKEVANLKGVYKSMIDSEKYFFNNTTDGKVMKNNIKMMTLFKNTINKKEKELKVKYGF